MKQCTTPNLLDLAKEYLVGRFNIVSALHLSVSPHSPTLCVVHAAHGATDGLDNPTASFDPDEAQFKALMKVAAERASFDRPDHSIISRADKLKYPYLNQEYYFPIEEGRAEERYLKLFSEKRRVHWVIGVTYDGRPVYIPEDFVYRGGSRDFLYFANESGIAAHPDQLTAVKLAILSRLKADAVMRTWYKQLSPYTISPQYLPMMAQVRIESWHKEGRTLTVSQLDNNYGEVYLAIIRGEKWPCFACGVGITIDQETDVAIMDAIADAEMNFDLLSSYPDDIVPKRYSAIQTCLGHGFYYADFNNSQSLSFLTERKELSKPFKRDVEFSELVRKLDLKLVWLSRPSQSFHVVRVFSPKLVPISYGYGLEHYNHPALSSGGSTTSDVAHSAPHCFMNP